MAEALVPWEEGFVIGQGFKCPGNFLVSRFAMAFDESILGDNLRQLTPGADTNEGGTGANMLDAMDFEWRMVSSYADLAKAFNGSARFGSRGFGMGFSATSSAMRQTSVTQTTIIGIMTAKFETDAFVYQGDPKLSTAAKAMLGDTDGVSKFFDTFGTHFVVGQKIGGAFTGMIEVRFSREADMNSFSLAAKGSAQSAGVKYSGAARFSAALNADQSEKDVRVKVAATGWNRTVDVSQPDGTELVTAEDLVRMAQDFAQNHQGVAVAAVLRPFNTLPEFAEAASKNDLASLRGQFPARSALESLAKKLTLESIKLSILSSTLAEIIESIPKYLQAGQDARTYLQQVEAAKLLIAETEDLEKQAQLLNHMKTFKWRKSVGAAAVVTHSADGTSISPEEELYDGIFVSEKIGDAVMELTKLLQIAGDPVLSLLAQQKKVPVSIKNFHGQYLSPRYDDNDGPQGLRRVNMYERKETWENLVLLPLWESGLVAIAGGWNPVGDDQKRPLNLFEQVQDTASAGQVYLSPDIVAPTGGATGIEHTRMFYVKQEPNQPGKYTLTTYQGGLRVYQERPPTPSVLIVDRPRLKFGVPYYPSDSLFEIEVNTT